MLTRVLAVACLALSAFAVQARPLPHGKVATELVAVGNCPYSQTPRGIDNGCAGSTQLLDGETIQPAWLFSADAGGMSYVAAESSSGQCPASTDPNFATCLKWRNRMLHQATWTGRLENLECIDYACGASDPTKLAAVSTLNDSDCQFKSTGSPEGGGPYVACQGPANIASACGTAAAPNTHYDSANSVCEESLVHYDGTNCGSGHGTCYTALVINSPQGGPVEYYFGDYFLQAGAGTFASNAYTMWNYGGELVFIEADTQAPITFDHVTCDGRFWQSPTGHDYLNMFPLQTVPAGDGGGIIACVEDQSQSRQPRRYLYDAFVHLGHIPIHGTDQADAYVKYSIGWDDCMGGLNGCHGEFLQYTGAHAVEAVTYVGDLYGTTSTPLGIGNATDTPFYIATGQPNDVAYTPVDIENDETVAEWTDCMNAPASAYPYYSAYNRCVPNDGSNPSFPLTGAQAYPVNAGGNGLLNTNAANYVASLTVKENIVDCTSCAGASSTTGIGGNLYGTSITALNKGGSTFLAGFPSAGGDFTVTSPNSGYDTDLSGTYLMTAPFWPGQVITDLNGADGFPDTAIPLTGSYGTYSNERTFTGSTSGGVLTTTTPVTLTTSVPNWYNQTQNYVYHITSSGRGGQNGYITTNATGTGPFTLSGTVANYSNVTMAAFNNTSGCDPASNPGCGTISITWPNAIAQSDSWGFYAGLIGTPASADNSSIGGNWGYRGAPGQFAVTGYPWGAAQEVTAP